MLKTVFSVLACVVIIGCSSSSDSVGEMETDSGMTNSVLSGVFLDSAVMGLTYATSTENGVTDVEGRLNYLGGEEVTLSIGQLSLPAFQASETMSPLSVFGATEVSDTNVQNLAILLQSLDSDSNPENGIEILESAASSAPDTIDFSQDSASFVADPAVLNLVANSGSTTTEPTSRVDASRHLQSTLVEANILESVNNVRYTNLIIGNTTMYTNEGFSYYYRPDGARFAMEGGDVVETTWSLDESGQICEVTTRGTDFCIADAPGLMLTKSERSGIYNYSDESYVGIFTVSEGDSLSLSN